MTSEPSKLPLSLSAKFPYPTAALVTSRYTASERVQELINNNSQPQLSPAQLLEQLARENNFSDLIIFLAHGLPPREGIGWALQCCSQVSEGLTTAETCALNAARQWYRQPSEDHRRLTDTAVQNAGLQTPPGWVAQSVFWSGGSITPVDTPLVSPPAWIYCHAIAAAINLAATLPDGSLAETLYPQFVECGISIASGAQPVIQPDV